MSEEHEIREQIIDIIIEEQEGHRTARSIANRLLAEFEMKRK